MKSTEDLVAKEMSNMGYTATQNNIDYHKMAALHHEEAAKYHREAAMHHEAGNHREASRCTILALGHHALAEEHQTEDVKFHAFVD